VSRKSIKIVTLNVLGWGYDIKTRSRRISSLLYKTNSDIIFLQEVKPHLMKSLLSSTWVREEYYGMFFPSKRRPYIGLYILSRYPIYEISYKKLSGIRKIRVLFATVKINDQEVRIANIHLEAPLDKNHIRAQQLKEVFSYLKDYPYSIIAGDFNFGDKDEPENRIMHSAFEDLWQILKPHGKGYTWNMKQNPKAVKNAYENETSRRLDRILFKKEVWEPVNVKIINHKWPLYYGSSYYPSDHYGLYGELKMIY